MTNCPATTVLTDWMILLHSKCMVVQISNKFLSQTAINLFAILLDKKSFFVINDDVDATFTTDSHKEWCIVQPNGS